MLDTLSVQTENTIFVDLDGTLIRSDLLWETLFLTARQKPLQLLKVPGWALSGKARLKAELANACDFDASTLPYRQCVIDALTRARAEGRRIVLATGANARLAHAVADHLGLFDDVMASCDTVNLTAERKLERIRAENGEAGFDYYGNSHEDICLLEHADSATVVSPDRSAARWQARTGSERMDDEGAKWRPALKALRPHQWMKNVLIFVPLALNHEFFDLTLVAGALLAFVSFSFVASAVYLINDLLDLNADRRHKTKRNRPFASGRLSIPTGLAMVLGLLAVSTAISTLLPIGFFVVMCGYMITTTAYSFFLKRMLLVDVMTLAALYSFRIIAGSEATAVDASFWLLAFAMFFFLSLALVKRYTELQDFGTGRRPLDDRSRLCRQRPRNPVAGRHGVRLRLGHGSGALHRQSRGRAALHRTLFRLAALPAGPLHHRPNLDSRPPRPDARRPGAVHPERLAQPDDDRGRRRDVHDRGLCLNGRSRAGAGVGETIAARYPPRPGSKEWRRTVRREGQRGRSSCPSAMAVPTATAATTTGAFSSTAATARASTPSIRSPAR